LILLIGQRIKNIGKIFKLDLADKGEIMEITVRTTSYEHQAGNLYLVLDRNYLLLEEIRQAANKLEKAVDDHIKKDNDFFSSFKKLFKRGE